MAHTRAEVIRELGEVAHIGVAEDLVVEAVAEVGLAVLVAEVLVAVVQEEAGRLYYFSHKFSHELLDI